LGGKRKGKRKTGNKPEFPGKILRRKKPLLDLPRIIRQPKSRIQKKRVQKKKRVLYLKVAKLGGGGGAGVDH